MKTGDVFLRTFRRTVAGFVSGCERRFRIEKRPQQTYTVPSEKIDGKTVDGSSYRYR